MAFRNYLSLEMREGVGGRGKGRKGEREIGERDMIDGETESTLLMSV